MSEEDVLSAIERGATGGASSGAGRHWVLDPVDGTLGFVRGDQYAVCLALVDRGQVRTADSGAAHCGAAARRWGPAPAPHGVRLLGAIFAASAATQRCISSEATPCALCLQVVAGLLGCPNMPARAWGGWGA